MFLRTQNLPKYPGGASPHTALECTVEGQPCSLLQLISLPPSPPRPKSYIFSGFSVGCCIKLMREVVSWAWKIVRCFDWMFQLSSVWKWRSVILFIAMDYWEYVWLVRHCFFLCTVSWFIFLTWHMYNFSQTEHLEVPRQRPVPMPRTAKVRSSLAGVPFSLVVYGIILNITYTMIV